MRRRETLLESLEREMRGACVAVQRRGAAPRMSSISESKPLFVPLWIPLSSEKKRQTALSQSGICLQTNLLRINARLFW